MSNTQQPIKRNNPEEQIEISFLGFRFKCSNPSTKAIIILVLLLIFFVVLVVLLPHPMILSG
jgi:hypothetical protein